MHLFTCIPTLLRLFAALVPVIAQAQTCMQIESIISVKSPTHSYAATIIKPVDTNAPIVNGANTRNASDLLKKTNAWVSCNFIQRHKGNHSDQALKDVQGVHMNLDSRSAYIIVWEGVGFENVLGTMRFTWPTSEHPYLPSDLELPESLQSKASLEQQSDYPWGKSLWENELRVLSPHSRNAPSKNKVLHSYETGKLFVFDPGIRECRTLLVGETWEIKNFAVQKGLEDDLVPLLFFLSERTSASHIAKTSTGLPGRYRLSAFPEMARMYQHLGFKMVGDGPLPNGHVHMEISRKEYLKRVPKAFIERPNAGWLQGARWDIEESLGLITEYALSPELKDFFRDNQSFEKFLKTNVFSEDSQ